MAIWNTVNLSEIRPDRSDAEYFRKDYKENIEYLKSTGEVTTLGKMFKYIKRGSQPLYSDNGTIKALRSVNVGFMNFNETRQEYVTEEFFKFASRGRVKKNDILITSTGVGTLGRTSIWYFKEKAYCDGHITILRDGDVDPYFVTAFLNSKYGLIQYDQNYRGSSGQIEIYPYDIAKFVIPKCLFPYQNEIGDYLRNAFHLQEQSQALYQQATELLEKELGLDKITFDNPKSYTARFSEVIETKRGDAEFFNPKLKNYYKFLSKKFNLKSITHFTKVIKFSNPDYANEGIPIITQKHLTKISPENYDGFPIASKEWVKKYPEAIIKENDLLYYSVGAYLGKTNIWFNKDIAVHASFITMLRSENKIDAGYLMILLNSKFGILQSKVYQSGTSQPYIYPKDIRQFLIPEINDELKTQMYNLIKQSFEAKEQSKQLLAQAKARVEELIEQAAKANKEE